ncbi:MAG: hypothetical protein HY342_09800 [Candidatus Lambdaproteobacteria bacterium]|nr:hypothetical protein [Candidatus Lambdaproteobacteria bacterium]
MSPVNAFANPHLLWTPQELHARLGDENLALIDLRTTAEVMTGIIPGAQHIDIYGVGVTQTTSPIWEEFANLMRSLFAMRGAGSKSTVVLYEENSGNKIGRAFWLLEYLGHTDVHVLDGGLGAWREAGYEVTQSMGKAHGRSFKPNIRHDIFITADELHKRLGDKGVCVLDTRSDEEWSGENTRGGPRGGTIPGAVHLEWLNYLDEKGKFKKAPQLSALFEGVGVLRDKAIVPF